MLRNIKIFLNKLSAATDRICSLQEEQQQLREQNELIREKSEKSVEVRNRPCGHSDMSITDLKLETCRDALFQRHLGTLTPLSGRPDHLGFPGASRPS